MLESSTERHQVICSQDSTSEAIVSYSGLLLLGEIMPQAMEFKYLRILFTSDGKIECETLRES